MGWNGRWLVELDGSIWMWTGNVWKRLYMGRSGLKLSRSGLKMSRSGLKWVDIDGSGLQLSGSGWKHGLVQPLFYYNHEHFSSYYLSIFVNLASWGNIFIRICRFLLLLCHCFLCLRSLNAFMRWNHPQHGEL